MKAKTLGKYLLTYVLVDCMARECPALGMNYQPVGQLQIQRQSVVVAFFLIILAVSAFMLWKLAQLCNRVIPNAPAPPPSTNAAPASVEMLASGGGETGHYKWTNSIPCHIPMQCIGVLTNQTQAFQDPSGGYYQYIAQAGIKSSPDMGTWTDEGSVKVWFNDNYALVAQYDTSSNQVSLVIYKQGWHDLGSSINLLFTENQQSQLFYSMQ